MSADAIQRNGRVNPDAVAIDQLRRTVPLSGDGSAFNRLLAAQMIGSQPQDTDPLLALVHAEVENVMAQVSRLLGETRPAVAPPAPTGTHVRTQYAATSSLDVRIAQAISQVETGHSEGFGQLTGNFDGQGWSYGMLQWNFGQGTLQGLLRDQRVSGAIDRVLPPTEASTLHQVAHMTPGDATRWAARHSDADGNPLPEWQTAMQRLGADSQVREAQLDAFRSQYLDRARQIADRLGIHSERGIAMLTDVCVQNGNYALYADQQATRPTSALQQYERSVSQHEATNGTQPSETERLVLLAKTVSENVAAPQWAQNTWERKIAFATGGQANGVSLDTFGFKA